MELWGGSYWLMMVHGSWIYIYHMVIINIATMVKTGIFVW